MVVEWDWAFVYGSIVDRLLYRFINLIWAIGFVTQI
jgi:hypothetical protein